MGIKILVIIHINDLENVLQINCPADLNNQCLHTQTLAHAFPNTTFAMINYYSQQVASDPGGRVDTTFRVSVTSRIDMLPLLKHNASKLLSPGFQAKSSSDTLPLAIW